MALPRISARPAAAVLLAIALGGCNVVYSDQPLFTRADEAGAPAMRPGLWLSDDAKCQFDETKPVQRWPTCASWSLVRAGQFLEYKAPAWTSMDYVLAAGAPRVLQVPFTIEKATAYVYAGLKPLRSDSDGRITAVRTWSAQCGPPPPQPPPGSAAPSDGKQRSVTTQPLPGLEIKDDNCIARDQGPVRASVTASEAWDTTPATAHWVRDALP